METEGTFGLTSLKDENKISFIPNSIKLPHIKSHIGFSKPGKPARSMTTSNLNRISQSSVTHDLLKSITERATS